MLDVSTQDVASISADTDRHSHGTAKKQGQLLARFGLGKMCIRSFARGSGVSNIVRREYDTVAEANSSEARWVSHEKKETKKKAESRRQKVWKPDPVTGYWVPEDHLGEDDQRESLLTNQADSRDAN
eukprot:Gb_37218 [translate_table: standard]